MSEAAPNIEIWHNEFGVPSTASGTAGLRGDADRLLVLKAWREALRMYMQSNLHLWDNPGDWAIGVEFNMPNRGVIRPCSSDGPVWDPGSWETGYYTARELSAILSAVDDALEHGPDYAWLDCAHYKLATAAACLSALVKAHRKFADRRVRRAGF